MNSSEIRQGRGDIQNIVYLLFGGSFLGIIILSGIVFGGWISIISFCAGTASLVLAFYLDKRKDVMSFLASWVVDVKPRQYLARYFAFLAIVMGGAIVAFVISLMTRGVATLAASGIYNPNSSSSGYDNAEGYLLIVILWLLLGVPHRAFKYELDRSGEGSAQRVLLGVLPIAASISTGIYILMMHFGGGPLQGISIQALTSGIIFTAFLILPAYRSLSKACWQHGISGLFSPKPLTKHWGKALEELDSAFRQAQATDRFLARRKPGETPGHNTLDGSNSDESRTDADPDPGPDPDLGPGHDT